MYCTLRCAKVTRGPTTQTTTGREGCGLLGHMFNIDLSRGEIGPRRATATSIHVASEVPSAGGPPTYAPAGRESCVALGRSAWSCDCVLLPKAADCVPWLFERVERLQPPARATTRQRAQVLPGRDTCAAPSGEYTQHSYPSRRQASHRASPSRRTPSSVSMIRPIWL